MCSLVRLAPLTWPHACKVPPCLFVAHSSGFVPEWSPTVWMDTVSYQSNNVSIARSCILHGACLQGCSELSSVSEVGYTVAAFCTLEDVSSILSFLCGFLTGDWGSPVS